MTKVSWDIQQCPLAKRCRARWEKLEPVKGDDAIRFCGACERSVYLCQTDEDLAKHRALGRCVALAVLDVGIVRVGESLPNSGRSGQCHASGSATLTGRTSGRIDTGNEPRVFGKQRIGGRRMAMLHWIGLAYLNGALLMGLFQAWRMLFRLDAFDWHYERQDVWVDAILATLLWPLVIVAKVRGKHAPQRFSIAA